MSTSPRPVPDFALEPAPAPAPSGRRTAGVAPADRPAASRPAASRPARGDLSWTLLVALHSRRAVHLLYGGAWRVVHPHALGPTRTGKRALLAWQTAGYGRSGAPEGWRLFDLSRIEAADMLGARFAPRPRPPAGEPWTRGVPDALAAV